MQKLFLLVLLFSTTHLLAQDTVKVDAEMTNATVYFGYGVELTHQAKVKMTNGTRIIVINKLSTTVDINSVQVSCPEDVTILSQRYNIEYPKPVVFVKTKEIERMEDSIEVLRENISKIDNDITIEQETMGKTGVLIETTITTSGNKTVTSDEVLKLVSFYTAKIEKSKTNIYNYGISKKKLNNKINEWMTKIGKLSVVPPSTEKAYGQLILQVVSKSSTEIPFSLSYYTRNAGWMPVYDIRVNSKTNKVKLVYKASLTQTTGVDWKNTKLILSTGTPNFGVEAPILTPWYLQLYVPALYRKMSLKSNALAMNTIPGYDDEKQLREVVVDAQGIKKDAYSLQTIDPSTLHDYTTLNEGQLNTNFEIALPYDIESDGQMHSIAIKDEMIDCTLKNYAVPKMQKEAYLLAELTDWENLDLLPGEANIIVDETYLGKSVIDPNTTADTLNIPLGKDRRVSVKRSLVKELSSLKSSGGVNKQTFTYEITVKNNKLTDVNLILKDQYPLSTIKEVEIEFKSDDLTDATVNSELGVITWKIDLKPGESKKVRFTYTVKYPKDKKIANLK